jgi:YidC/Oxa1 family membrane protein insertase
LFSGIRTEELTFDGLYKEMTDVRRTLLWVVFCMSLVLIWDAWNRHNGQPSFLNPGVAAKASRAPAAAPPGTPASAAAMASGLPTPKLAANATPAAIPASSPTVVAAAAEPITVTTDKLKATFDSKGGNLIRLELLDQADTAQHQKNTVLLDRSPERLYEAQTGLVPPAGGTGLPNHHTLMSALPGDRSLKTGEQQLVLRFESPVLGDIKLIKNYTLHRGSYLIDVKHEVMNVGASSIKPRLYHQLVRDGNPAPGTSQFYFTFTGPAVYTDEGKYQKVDFKNIEKRGANENPNHITSSSDGWVAMVQHYFASVWLVDQPGLKIPREIYTSKVDTNTYSVGFFVDLGEIKPGDKKTFDSKLFTGPQEEKKLAELAPGLQLIKDYGYFKIIAEPLFWLLDKLHVVLNNWGWAIISLVVLLKIAFYGLNANAYRSMAKMKAVNPKVMAMRERLKDQPQQLQQEMLRIYREEKVNPFGGCLPIFVQMPFFIALYWVLLSSVEMRNAPWIAWVTDLSAPDPYFILPLLMTLSSLAQTWLNPKPADPMQARMMWIMPLIFSGMFFFFPSGLVLYWLTNNILSIAQQYFINRKLGVLE